MNCRVCTPYAYHLMTSFSPSRTLRDCQFLATRLAGSSKSTISCPNSWLHIQSFSYHDWSMRVVFLHRWICSKEELPVHEVSRTFHARLNRVFSTVPRHYVQTSDIDGISALSSLVRRHIWSPCWPRKSDGCNCNGRGKAFQFGDVLFRPDVLT